MERQGTIQIQQQPWAILVAKSKGLADQKLIQHLIKIGRKNTNNIIINDQRLSSQHCILSLEGQNVMIEDKSSNGTFVNNTKMTKGAKLMLQHGNQIWLLHPTKVTPQNSLGYIIEITKVKKQQQLAATQKEQQNVQLIATQKSEQLKREFSEKEQEIKKKNIQQMKAFQQEKKKMNQQKKKLQQQSQDLLKSIKEQITCCICLQIMFLPVTVHPCNHRFCGSCLTGLIKSKQQNCAQCRKQITTAQRDSSFNSLIEDYLKSHPDEVKSKQEQQEQTKTNMFKHETIDVHQFIHGKKKPKQDVAPVAVAIGGGGGLFGRGVPLVSGRARRGRVARRGSDLSANESDDQNKCRQCNVARNGFQCPATQVHVPCVTCAKLIPRRNDAALNQCCVLCDQYFCNLYFPPCANSGVKLMQVKNRQNQVKIDENTFRGNANQYNIFRTHLLQKKLNAREIFNNILTNHLDKNTYRYLVDRKIMKISPIASRQVPVSRESAVCDLCWPDLWFQMILLYRININRELPPAVSGRPDCYYGINCKTMVHNLDHAKKLNHCCYQTKF